MEEKGKDRKFWELPSNLLKCRNGEMVEVAGIEPASARDPRKGATYLVRILLILQGLYEQNLYRKSPW